MAKKPTGAAPKGAFPKATVAAEAASPAMAAPAADVKQNGVAGTLAGYQATPIEEKTTMEKAMKSAEEFVSFSQGNFEAMVKASQIWAAGVQDLGKTVSATAQAQAEAAMGTFKALSGVKSLKEAMDLQASLARSSFETAMNESGKITEASVKLAEQAMAPITARVTLAVEKFGRVA
jgi:hypothetical protein